jgi:DNA repair exonuclease SbcCD ATPase subunit
MEENAPSSSPLETASALSAAALRELQQRAQSALSASREQAARLEADITRQLDELASTLSEQTELEVQNASEAEVHHAEITRLTAELAKEREAWATEKAALERQRDELAAQISHLQTQSATSQEEWRNQLIDFEGRLVAQQTSWNEQRSELTAARTTLESERDELQQKFELALQDVQRLRGRMAELEHDLARRPEVNQADSAELVALRAERDALSSRVEDLEQQPAVQIDPDVEQQLSDLQRRFELAVEDVRELKTKNAKLESQLASAGTRAPSAAPTDAGGMDWESQKRRLLASLDDHADADDDPVQKQDRLTVENTIEMTDAVVAEKDRQIAALEAQLSAGAAKPSADDEAHHRKINELIDADAVIAEHRKRAAQLEREMDDKLRAAELEISVERAKLARQRAELEELRSTLESQRQSLEASGGAPALGAPKRRWLSKLGIDGKEKE